MRWRLSWIGPSKQITETASDTAAVHSCRLSQVSLPIAPSIIANCYKYSCKLSQVSLPIVPSILANFLKYSGQFSQVLSIVPIVTSIIARGSQQSATLADKLGDILSVQCTSSPHARCSELTTKENETLNHRMLSL